MDFSKSNRNGRVYDAAMLQQAVDAYNNHASDEFLRVRQSS